MAPVETTTVETISGGEAADTATSLLARYAEHPEQGLRDELVAAHRGLVRWAAGKFSNRGEPTDDLEQVAAIGLLKAIDRFDSAQGAGFSSYAVATMLGELKRHFRDHAWKLHLPRSLHDRHLAVRGAIQSLTQELGRSPTIAEIGRRAGLSSEQVVEAMEVSSRGRPSSLEARLDSDGPDDDPALAEAPAEMAFVEQRADVTALLERLPPRERMVVSMRFMQEMSQAEIGKRLGVSQMQISRILSQSLVRLRNWAGDGAGVGALA
jgi:RNA polymerase sigma-B factor